MSQLNRVINSLETIFTINMEDIMGVIFSAFDEEEQKKILAEINSDELSVKLDIPYHDYVEGFLRARYLEGKDCEPGD